MRRSILAVGVLLLVASIATAGCGSDSVQVADSSPTATSKQEKPPFPHGDKGYEEDGTEDPEITAMVAQSHQRLAAWLRSEYVKNLDPRDLSQTRKGEFFGGGMSTFEEAVDFGDVVVSGQVKDLLFVPFGTVATFQVDRTAKGEPKSTVYIMQASYVEPVEGDARKTNNAQVIYDPGWSMLFDGDRAVLALQKIPELDAEQAGFIGDSLGGAPLYEIVRGRGQYLLADGKVRSEENNTPVIKPDRGSDGKTEKELMDTAETYAKDERTSYKSAIPSVP